MEESDRLRSLRCGRKRALQKKKEIEKQKEDERRREFEIQQALRKQQEDRQKQRAIIEQERQRQSVINNQNPFTDSPAPARTVPQSPIQNKEEVTTFGPFSAFKNFPSFPRNVLDNQSLEQGIETNSRPALRGPNLLPTRPTGPPPPQRIQPQQSNRAPPKQQPPRNNQPQPPRNNQDQKRPKGPPPQMCQDNHQRINSDYSIS